MSSELGWARCTTMERFMMLKLQLQQPAAVVILSNIKTNTPKQCSTKKMASELATSSSSIAAVGETAARLAIEPRSPHGRHGERERRGQPLPASVFAPCWEVYVFPSVCSRCLPSLKRSLRLSLGTRLNRFRG
jgi:hypothetical protein